MCCTMLQLHENFFKVFGVEKCRRIGEAECAAAHLELNPSTQELQSGAFDRLAAARTKQVCCREIVH